MAGDFDIKEAKKMIERYFNSIPSGPEVEKIAFKENPISQPILGETFDKNIQIPALITAYRTPKKTARDSRVLDMISSYLSDRKSSKLYRKLVDEKKMSLEVAAFNMSMEDYGLYVILSIPLGDTELTAIKDEFDQEIEKIQTALINPKDYEKLLKQINRVTKEEIMAAAQKYFLSDHAQIVVTGNGEVLENLEQLEFKGKPLPLRYFDQWGAEIQRPDYSNSIPEGMTAARVVNNYLEALGGMSKLRELRTYKEIAKAEMQGMALEVVSHKTNQKQSLTELKVRGSVMQKQVVNKDYAYLEMQGQKIDLEGAVFNQMTTGAAIIPELNFDFETIELKGIREIDGKKAYEIKVAEGLSYFYDTERFLKIQISQTMELMGSSQTTITKLGAYKEVEGILLPHQTTLSMGPQEINFELELIELNTAIDPQIFK